MAAYILALDQGTSSSRAILFDRMGRPVSVAQREVPPSYPRPGWVEHDPEAIWATQLDVAREAIAGAGVSPSDVQAIGIANQRETTILWDRATGVPVAPAIVWQDRRTADLCERLKADGTADAIQATTGLVVDSYFSATKLAWLLDHVPGARARGERGELAFGTVDSFLLWRLTGGVHATDVSNASRTMLYDLDRQRWCPRLLGLFGIPESVLPEVVSSSGVVGHTDLLGPRTPIAGLVGDQQAATFGQACFRPGMAKCTYGTGGFLLMHTGAARRASANRLLSTVAWRLGDAPTEYALEGSVFVAGAAIQWLRDELGLLRSADESEAVARSVPDTAGVVFVPAFVGLGAPHWDPYARGALVGLTRGSGRAHLVRAALESIAFQCRDVLEAMGRDAGRPVAELRVDGGASRNDFLMQFQADLLGVPVLRPRVTETTALGAACLAGLATGFWDSTDEIASRWAAERTFLPAMSADERDARVAEWQTAVDRIKTRPER